MALYKLIIGTWSFGFIMDRNNGFLKYFEMKQIPNFLLASPMILLSLIGIFVIILHDPLCFMTLGWKCTTKDKSISFVNHPKLRPWTFMWMFMLFLCMTSMHVQIMPRFFSALPIIHWFTAYLFEKKHWLRYWVMLYFTLYSSIGAILFAMFYPPA
jgi:phosphatidylinositol glycan class V